MREFGKSVDSTFLSFEIGKNGGWFMISCNNKVAADRYQDGRRDPFGPHAHNEKDGCAEAGNEQGDPEEPGRSNNNINNSNNPRMDQSINLKRRRCRRQRQWRRQVWHHAPPPARWITRTEKKNLSRLLPSFLSRQVCMIKIMTP